MGVSKEEKMEISMERKWRFWKRGGGNFIGEKEGNFEQEKMEVSKEEKTEISLGRKQK